MAPTVRNDTVLQLKSYLKSWFDTGCRFRICLYLHLYLWWCLQARCLSTVHVHTQRASCRNRCHPALHCTSLLLGFPCPAYMLFCLYTVTHHIPTQKPKIQALATNQGIWYLS